MLHIAFDHQIFSHQRVGGISRYFSRLIKELARLEKRARPRAIAPVHQNQYLSSLQGNLVTGFGIGAYPPGTSSLIWSVNDYLSQVALRHWKPSILHRTYYGTPVSQFRPKVTVVTVLDMIHELFKEHFAPDDTTATQKKIAVQTADHVICISENTRRDLITLLGIAPEKVTCVHLGFDRLALTAADYKNMSISRPFLLYVGARKGYKNFIRLLEAFASSSRLIQDFDLVAFGGGPFHSAELDKIKQLRLEGHVRQVSGGDEMLAAHYNQASAFVYPSLYEGFGLPPLEAMASGCPVVSSYAGSLREVIANAAEYFDPQNTDEIMTAIERVVYSDQHASQLIAAGALRIEEFSWARCAQETLAIYERLA